MKMHLRLISVGLFVSSVILPVQAQRGGGSDQERILGVWRGNMPGEPPGSIELTITPDRISGRNPLTGESLGEGSYHLDPANKTIDSYQGAKFGRGKTYVGRYSLEDGTLKWVSNSRGKRRPADLAHRPERDQFLMILKRQR